MVKPLVRLALWPFGLVTVTVRAPTVAAAEIVMLAVNCVDKLNAQELTVMPLPKLQVAPLWKLLPAIVTAGACPRVPFVGFSPLTVGAGPDGGIREGWKIRNERSCC